MPALRFDREDLKGLSVRLLSTAGLEAEKARVVAELLVQTDELGVTTHGTSMAAYYVPELRNGNMQSSGRHDIVSDREVAAVWDGNYLPGHWLMTQALEQGMERARRFGVSTLAIRRSHHIGCLSALTRIAANEGFVCIIATSDPAGSWVAPYGGTQPVLTPNPWAVGYPGKDHPVLIDTCASITTVSKVREHINSGTRFAHPWMLDANGTPTTDPNVVNATPKGSILPVGGVDHGHKGFALGLTVEMLTQALSGHGRAEAPSQWGANVFLQIMDPEAFGGREAFVREVEHLNAECRASPPAPGFDRVRIPGDRAKESLSATRADGVVLPEEVWTRVSRLASEMGIGTPGPLAGTAAA